MPSRTSDFNQLAKLTVGIASEEVEDHVAPKKRAA
jgi:hypothetical protein